MHLHYLDLLLTPRHMYSTRLSGAAVTNLRASNPPWLDYSEELRSVSSCECNVILLLDSASATWTILFVQPAIYGL